MNTRISRLKDDMNLALAGLYDQREAENITKIYHSDKWKDSQFLTTDQLIEWKTDLSKLLDGVPVQYVTGFAYFYDALFHISSDVLIPRPETEELCYKIIQDLDGIERYGLDVGTGSGCIPIILQKHLPGLQMTGIDISEKALDVAKKNAVKLNVKVTFLLEDFLDKENWKKHGDYNLIVSNPPYIGKNEKAAMGINTLNHEPHTALFPLGNDPLVFYRYLAEFGQTHLTKGGNIYTEMNEFYSDEISTIFRDAAYNTIEVINDLQGKERILKCRKN